MDTVIYVYLVGHHANIIYDDNRHGKEWDRYDCYKCDRSICTYAIGTRGGSVVADLLEVHRVHGILDLLLAPKSPRGLLGETVKNFY